MKPFTKPGFLIAAPQSGSGKSILTMGLMAAFREEYRVQGYKVGPDYIDPMYHTAACGRPSVNLDAWMLSKDQIRSTYVRHAQDADLCITEGVMGLFDGFEADLLRGSTAEIAMTLGLPIILVIDCSKMSGSAAAIIHGFNSYAKGIQIAGVICNQVGSEKHLQLLNDAIAPLGLPVLGFVPKIKKLTIPERHLGLLIPEEQKDSLSEYLEIAKQVVQDSINLPQLYEISQSAAKLKIPPSAPIIAAKKKVRLAVARDKAFCFYYPENLERLRDAGAELSFFSPLEDSALPKDIQGIYLGGGYPELYTDQLSANEPLRKAILSFAQSDGLIYAECGGLIYLLETFVGKRERKIPMCGVIPGFSVLSPKLTIGYREITPLSRNWLITEGMCVRSHEFHYSSCSGLPKDKYFVAMTSALGQTLGPDGYASGRVIASYNHIHFGQDTRLVENFIQAME